MIEKYSYRLKNDEKFINCGQCDEQDFKNFWQKMKDHIETALVLQDGKTHMYMAWGDKHYKWITIHHELPF